MNYEKFCSILNKHIFEGEKKELLEKISEKPERFMGFFRPTKPTGKILQHILQSHEIRMGDAFEEIIEEILKSIGYKILSKIIVNENNQILSLDQYFTDGRKYFFIEQKLRDDHDSSKKRGQMSNFEAKLEALYKEHSSNLVGIMYFIDPDLSKNKNYYLEEFKKLTEFYNVELHLFYGRELFEYLGKPDLWEQMLSWLKNWKDSLPEFPQINFDSNPEKSFNEIKNLGIRHWRRILENDRLWEEGVMNVIFREGKTLIMLYEFFKSKDQKLYKELTKLLEEKLKLYFKTKL
jgi:hypothetical protein